MPSSIKNPRKKSRGRPRVDSEQVNLRIQRPLLSALDRFIAENGGQLSRPEAVRQILAERLKP
jgi:metal-responsive CopG/Arc/MetJ family transcriptional regulator